MTQYRKCPHCGKVRMLYQVVDGEYVRTCFACFKTQACVLKWGPVQSILKRAVCLALSITLIGSLVAGPVWAEQIVLDGQEFRAHVEHDKQVQADRDNLEQQVGLYRQNEMHYKSVVKELKALQQKTEEKSSAQESLLSTYEAQRVQLVDQQKELADEVRRVKQDKETLTWKQRGEGFAAGVLVVGAVVAYLLRGGR